jgi:hypothetical protein
MAKRDLSLYPIGAVVILVAFLVFHEEVQRYLVPIQSRKIRLDSKAPVRRSPADPYHPPERENPYLFGRDYSYQQVGLLEKAGSMLPLFGRPSPKSSNRWEYYTMNSGLKLPVSMEGKPCNSDTGCPEMLSGNGDLVDVLGLGGMKSFIYDTKQLRR